MRDIRDEGWGKGLPSSIEQNGETIRIVAVPLGAPRLSKASSKCAARIMDAFRMRGVGSVSFLVKDFAGVDYNQEQCNSELKKQPGADTRLISYVSLILKCLSNRQNATKIKGWLDVYNAKANNGYQSVDFRLFDLAFAKSELCKDRKDFALYYECFVRAISEESLSEQQAQIPARGNDDTAEGTPSKGDVPRAEEQASQSNVDRQLEQAGRQAGDDGVELQRRVVPSVAAPEGAPSGTSTSAPIVPLAPAPHAMSTPRPTAGPEPVLSVSLLTDYLLLLAMVALSLTVLAFAWKFARRRDRDSSKAGVAQELDVRETPEPFPHIGAGEVPSAADPVSIVPASARAHDAEAALEHENSISAMQLQISKSNETIERQGRDLDNNREVIRQLRLLEAKFTNDISELAASNRNLQDKLTASEAQGSQLAKARDDLTRQCAELKRREFDLVRQRDELTRRCDELTRERDDLNKVRDDLASQRDKLTTERDEARQQRDNLANRLEFANSQAERLKSGLPLFLSPADIGNPLSDFWVASAKANPQAHSRLEGALRSYKIASEEPSESSGKLFELVNDIGVQLYALMDAIALDEPSKREIAANWQAALNSDGERRFLVSVPWPGTAIEPLEMIRKDQRCRSERINHVRSWVVKDKDGRVARRAIVE